MSRRSLIISGAVIAATAPAAAAALAPTLTQVFAAPTAAAVSACAAGVLGLTLNAARKRDHDESMAEADRIAGRIAGTAHLGVPALPQGSTVIPGEIVTDPKASGSCPGHMVRHEDGHITCHKGRDDCWPGISAYQHTRDPEPCATQSHGCGECLITGSRP